MLTSTRILFFVLYFGIQTFMLGCVQNEASLEHHPSSERNRLLSEASNASNQKEIQFLHASHVSFITTSGQEFHVDTPIFKEKWVSLMRGEFEISEESERSQPTFTIIVWDEEKPTIIQMYENTLKMGQQHYHGKAVQEFLDWMKEFIGVYYFDTVEMDRMSLHAHDLGVKTQIPEKQANKIREMLQQSLLVKGDVRIEQPLYPYYQVDLEFGKDYIQVDILSPTLIRVHDGNDQWYYQLSHSIFSYLTDIIPVTVYSNTHVKSLFQAENMTLLYEGGRVNIEDEIEDDLHKKSFLHSLTRLMADGEPDPEQSEEEVIGNASPIIIEFQLAGYQQMKVIVTGHYFIFHDQIYYLQDIEDQIKSYIDI